MDFGRKLLSKFGWEEGKGLGKSEDGIVNPLKPKLKFDSTGIGFDYSKEYVNDWWAQSYNKALKKVDVSKKSKNKRKSIAEDQCETTDRKKTKNFIKTETLLEDGSHVPEPNINHETTEVEEPKSLNYEKLFELCGGRTAHKGARHGLGLNGKLARLEAQEKGIEFSPQQASKASSKKKSSNPPKNDVNCSNNKEEECRSKESRKCMKSKADVSYTNPESSLQNCEETQEEVPQKKKKKRKSDVDVELKSEDLTNEISKRKKSKKAEEPFLESENTNFVSTSKRKKEKKSKTVTES